MDSAKLRFRLVLSFANSWANVLLTQARGMMLAASDRDNKLELIKCAKRCLVRSGKLFERIFSHNLCPDAHKYNVRSLAAFSQ